MKKIIVTFASFAFLAGCSEVIYEEDPAVATLPREKKPSAAPVEDAGPEQPSAPKCQRTYCDVEYSRCLSQGSSCESARDACRKGIGGDLCVDGIADVNVPDPDGGILGWEFVWKPPAPRQNACSDASINRFLNGCYGASATQAACEAAFQADMTCARCMYTKATAPSRGPFVYSEKIEVSNDGGCIALIEANASASGCGAKLWARDRCMSRCWGAEDRKVCETVAEKFCKYDIDQAASCEQKVATEPKYAVCMRSTTGALDFTTLTPYVRFFCGAP